MAKFILRKHGEGVKEATWVRRQIRTIVIRQHHSGAHEQVDERLRSIRLSHGLAVVCAGLDCDQRFKSITTVKSTTSAHRRRQSEHQPSGESATGELFG